MAKNDQKWPKNNFLASGEIMVTKKYFGFCLVLYIYIYLCIYSKEKEHV